MEPLTRKALKRHLATITPSDQSTLVDDPFTRTRVPSASASLIQTPISTSKSQIEAHHMLIHKGILNKPEMASFRELIIRVADTVRPSGRKPKSEQGWQNRIDMMHDYNEATMLGQILPLLVKVGRQVPVEGRPPTQQNAIPGLHHVFFLL